MLTETQTRYSCRLQDMQQIISHYEEELMQLRQDLERQNNEHKVLLGIKSHLEKEIATYRQLLEGDIEGWGSCGWNMLDMKLLGMGMHSSRGLGHSGSKEKG